MTHLYLYSSHLGSMQSSPGLCTVSDRILLPADSTDSLSDALCRGCLPLFYSPSQIFLMLQCSLMGALNAH